MNVGKNLGIITTLKKPTLESPGDSPSRSSPLLVAALTPHQHAPPGGAPRRASPSVACKPPPTVFAAPPPGTAAPPDVPAS